MCSLLLNLGKFERRQSTEKEMKWIFFVLIFFICAISLLLFFVLLFCALFSRRRLLMIHHDSRQREWWNGEEFFSISTTSAFSCVQLHTLAWLHRIRWWSMRNLGSKQFSAHFITSRHVRSVFRKNCLLFCIHNTDIHIKNQLWLLWRFPSEFFCSSWEVSSLDSHEGSSLELARVENSSWS